MIHVILKAGKEEAVLRFHPWIFSGAIARVEGEPADGDIVEVWSKSRRLLGLGHFHHGSIAVRMLSFESVDLSGPDFWIEKIREAWRVRQIAGLANATDTDCFRLIHGEGDGLSGLIIDLYKDTAVMQAHSIGMHRQRALIAEALQEALGDRLKAVYDKSADTLPPNYAAGQHNEYLWQQPGFEPSGEAVVSENGVQFKVNWVTGQKTGFFLDQRDNRQLLARYAQGKTVLNAFCYTGGFSAYALKAGAASVDSVDVSGKAMDLAAENTALNLPYPGRHQGYTEDVLRFLQQTEQRYEVMVIDPPAYAKSLEKRHNAIQGYKRLNAAAMQKLAPDGILFTFSCSQVVDRALFYHTIVAAALESGRRARVLHHLTQGADHPVSLFHPEGSYLKGLVLHIS